MYIIDQGVLYWLNSTLRTHLTPPPDNFSHDFNDFVTDTTIPVLEEAMTSYEVKNQVQLLKSNKTSAPDGLPPGIIKMLYAQWILMITNVFSIFQVFILILGHRQNWLQCSRKKIREMFETTGV